MSKINKKRYGRGWAALLVPLGLFDLGLVLYLFIHDKNIALFQSKGLVAHEQRSLLIFTIVLLLAVSIPVMFMLYYTAWKYRDSNVKAVYAPQAKQRKLTTGIMWGFPIVVLLVFSPVLWMSTHKLEPRKALAGDKEPVVIQVISMRWKWVFMYPEQKIATVNFVQIPKDTPIVFQLTADEAPMSSFWIPNLGGQLYSMTSHVNELNLMGETIGDYPGSSAELNGEGFAGMKFTTRVSSEEDFTSWVDGVRQTNNMLDNSKYDALVKPSENNAVTVYSDYQNDLYSKVVQKYMGSHSAHNTKSEHEGEGH